MTEWHHGYSAGAMLGLVSRALREASETAYFADRRATLSALADELAARGSGLSPDAYDVATEICDSLLTLLRTLCGSPAGSMRLDYLLFGVGHRQSDWIESMKRRPGWLSEVA